MSIAGLQILPSLPFLVQLQQMNLINRVRVLELGIVEKPITTILVEAGIRMYTYTKTFVLVRTCHLWTETEGSFDKTYFEHIRLHLAGVFPFLSQSL